MRSIRLLFCVAALISTSCSDDDFTDTDGQAPPQDASPDGSQPGDGPSPGDVYVFPPDSQPSCSGGGVVVPATWEAIKAGAFSMGSPSDEYCRDGDEAERQVTITRGFEITSTEVTQEQFRSLIGYNPSFHQTCGDKCPVEWVTWHEAAAYCNALSKAKGKPLCYSCDGCGLPTRCTIAKTLDCEGYRLPTEAEWEYAARAGSQGAYYNGGNTSCMGTDSKAGLIAWYKVNSGGESHPVGSKDPNDWKLYDMSGSVYEWTQDWYAADPSGATDPTGPASGTERVFKGGAWYFNAEHARSANRERFRPDKRFTFLGFRCVRTTP